MLDALLDQPLEWPDVGRRPAGHEAGSRRLGQPAEVEGGLHLAVGSGGRPILQVHGGRDLPPGHAVGLVVEEDAA